MEKQDFWFDSKPAVYQNPLQSYDDNIYSWTHSMPILNPVDIIERLNTRIAQLERGDELDAREIHSLLTEAQQQALKDAWEEQRDIRTRFKTQKAAEKAGAVWMKIREVRLDACRKALQEALVHFDKDMQQRQEKKDIRAARIYLDAYFEAVDADRDKDSAVRNALKRAKLKLPEQSRSLSERDKEVHSMEAKIIQKARENLTEEELEQLELVEEFERNHPNAL